MNKQLKDKLDKSRRKIQQISETIDKKSDQLSAESQQLWLHAKTKLSDIHEKLNQASAHLGSQAEGANLQVHLAAMEAHDKWQELSKSFDKFTQVAVRQTKTKVDHVALQSHLAKLDAKDYIVRTEKHLAHDVKMTQSQVEKTTLAALDDMQVYFKRIAKSLDHKN